MLALLSLASAPCIAQDIACDSTLFSLQRRSFNLQTNVKSATEKGIVVIVVLVVIVSSSPSSSSSSSSSSSGHETLLSMDKE